MFHSKAADPLKLDTEYVDDIWEDSVPILKQMTQDRFRHHYKEKAKLFLTGKAAESIRRSEFYGCSLHFPFLTYFILSFLQKHFTKSNNKKPPKITSKLYRKEAVMTKQAATTRAVTGKQVTGKQVTTTKTPLNLHCRQLPPCLPPPRRNNLLQIKAPRLSHFQNSPAFTMIWKRRSQ